jgi:hypothetical protein
MNVDDTHVKTTDDLWYEMMNLPLRIGDVNAGNDDRFCDLNEQYLMLVADERREREAARESAK